MTHGDTASLERRPATGPGGRATRLSGRRTARRITEAAYDLLRTGGIVGFSVRAVAKGAGVRLATVQYHFPKMQDLVRGVIALNAERYAQDYEQAALTSGGSPRDRLQAVIAFNLRDIQSTETRRFFINLWPLLESLDDFSGSLLAELYAAQFDLLSRRLRELHPKLHESEALKRAELIAALIEGMFITLPQTGGISSDLQALNKRALALCMAIADGEF